MSGGAILLVLLLVALLTDIKLGGLVLLGIIIWFFLGK